MGEQQNEEVMTIGKRLRQLTNQANRKVEIDTFVAALEDAANNRLSSLAFPDLRQYLNSMIMDGTIWEWLKSQDLIPTGEIDQNTGAYNFTISW